MRTRRPRRLKTFDYVGFHRYFLTFTAFRYLPRFKDAGTVTLTLQQFLRAAAAEKFEIVAYCFMPNHVHLLVAGTAEDSNARRFIALSKQLSGFTHRTRTGTRLWKPGGWDRVLRGTDPGQAIYRYILMNPVRAGLVNSALDYPYTGSMTMRPVELLRAAGL